MHSAKQGMPWTKFAREALFVLIFYLLLQIVDWSLNLIAIKFFNEPTWWLPVGLWFARALAPLPTVQKLVENSVFGTLPALWGLPLLAAISCRLRIRFLVPAVIAVGLHCAFLMWAQLYSQALYLLTVSLIILFISNGICLKFFKS